MNISSDGKDGLKVVKKNHTTIIRYLIVSLIALCMAMAFAGSVSAEDAQKQSPGLTFRRAVESRREYATILRDIPFDDNRVNFTYSETTVPAVQLTASASICVRAENPDICAVLDDLHDGHDHGVDNYDYAYDDLMCLLDIKKSGTAVMTFYTEENECYAAETLRITIHVDKAAQSVTVKESACQGVCGGKVKVPASAKTAVKYKSSQPKTAAVSSKGVVTLKRPGKAVITAYTEGNDRYAPASAKVTVSSVLKKPSISFTVSKGKAKITWSRVPQAGQYQLYIKYPGKKKFVKVLTRSANVKSVTHKGIAKGLKYTYKVRARKKIGKKYYYSPFSKARTITGR